MLRNARRLTRLCAPLLAFALLPTTAAIAAPPPHVVSLDQARAAMPDASTMPGRLEGIVTDEAPVAAAPCVGPNVKLLRMKQSHQVNGLYFTRSQSQDSSPRLIFLITAYVFHTNAAARTGMNTVLRLEAHCPKRQSDATATGVRTVSVKYSANGWTGWRSVDQVVPSHPSDTSKSLRANTEFLLRGNVMLVLLETSTMNATNGPQQEASRKQATRAMLAGFAKL